MTTLASSTIGIPQAARFHEFGFSTELVNPYAGVVGHLTEMPVEPGDPKVFCFLAELAKAERVSGALNEIFCSSAGLTRAAAARGAVGEGVERLCAAHFEDVQTTLSSYHDLRDAAVAPEEFALFGSHQFHDGVLRQPSVPDPPPGDEDLAQLAVRLRDFPPVEFTRSTPVRWIQMFDLARHERVLAPAALVFLSCQLADGESYIWDAITTGLACGPTPADAILHGLLEVIERDAIKITWANRLPRRRIELEADPTVAGLLRDRFSGQGIRFHLFDVSLDLPGVTVLGFMEDVVHDTRVAAAATRLDARDAVTKCLLELCQARIGMKRECIRPPRPYRDDFLDVYNFDDHAWLYMHPSTRHHLSFLLDGETTVDITDMARDDRSAEEQLRTITSDLADRGFRVLVADLTTEDVRRLGYTVVRVLVPGLQDIDYAQVRPFEGGTRLYNVPYELGLRLRPSTPAELNPAPHPLP
jgi:ribosomal protein S12 methylthiotransferase accessory factor